jgi:hypothetical protein
MEIKVQCSCGTKFKFDVEPVNNRMPAPVSCPSCGADGTEQANEFLRASLSLPPPAAPIRVTPVPRVLPAGQLPPVPPPIRPVDAGTAFNAPPPPPIAPVLVVPAAARARSKGPLVGTLVALLFLVFMGFGTWRVCQKWFKRFQLMADIAATVSKAGAASTASPQNLNYDDAVVLFIKHTNHLEIAEACKGFWKEKLGKRLTAKDSSDLSESKGEYQLVPSHNGYVRLIGTLDWPVSQFEKLSLHLSQNFNTLVFEVQDVDFSGAYHFGVYDQGARKFHAQMDIKITENSEDEIFTTEGNDWAIANGYKPGPEGFKSFSLDDADKITQRLGLKLWDEPEGADLKGLVLKE